jgi:hypothetical protein
MELFLLAVLLACVLALVACVALILAMPTGPVVLLANWPSKAWLGTQLAFAAVNKGKAPVTSGPLSCTIEVIPHGGAWCLPHACGVCHMPRACACGGRLRRRMPTRHTHAQAALSQPVGWDLTLLGKFRGLVGHAALPSDEIPVMYPIAESFRLFMQVGSTRDQTAAGRGVTLTLAACRRSRVRRGDAHACTHTHTHARTHAALSDCGSAGCPQTRLRPPHTHAGDGPAPVPTSRPRVGFDAQQDGNLPCDAPGREAHVQVHGMARTDARKRE